MKVTVHTISFMQAVAAVKPALSKDDCREILKYIHFTAKDNKLTLFACDGFVALRYMLPCEVDEPCEGFIAPVSLRSSKGQKAFTTIQCIPSMSKTILTVPSTYGEISYSFKHPEGNPLNEDKLFDLADGYVEAGFNANLLARAIKAFSGFKVTGFSLLPNSPLVPARVRSIVDKEAPYSMEGIVLPMRYR